MLIYVVEDLTRNLVFDSFWHNVSLAKYIIHWWWSLNSSLLCCLTFCSLRGNKISAEGVCAMVRVFQVNQSLQKLKLSGWVQPFSSSNPVLEIVCDTWKHLHGWCVHSWLMIAALIRAPHLWPTTECTDIKCSLFDNKESIVLVYFCFFLVYYCKCIQASTHLD